MLKSDLLNIIADLKNRRPESIGNDDPITDQNYNNIVFSLAKITEALELINKADPNIPPVGSKYVRFPGDPEPHERYPHPTAQWKNVSSRFPGDFLRIEGGNAAVFSENTSVSYTDGIGKEGGAQMDALQEHTHTYRVRTGAARNGPAGWRCAGDGSEYPQSSGANNTRKTSETRPKNITVQLWERVK
ncbi:hypothetical protein V1L52_10030 [Treponema sp. HNW]|uniref:hypothetical protein n=1 Tax=Treponema sp. HNW TaxID=3116654 RepID=UPI003D0D5889